MNNSHRSEWWKNSEAEGLVSPVGKLLKALAVNLKASQLQNEEKYAFTMQSWVTVMTRDFPITVFCRIVTVKEES